MKSILIISLLAVALFSCNTPDECEKCIEAINHMKGKIAQNQCNPANMENAVNRIKDDCDDDASAHIYYLAEMCSNGYAMTAACPDLPSSSQIEFVVDFSNGQLGDTTSLFITWPNQSQVSYEVWGGTFGGFKPEKGIREGMQLEFQLINKNDVVVATEKQRFSFVRVNNYDIKRFINISFDQNTGYSITFEYW